MTAYIHRVIGLLFVTQCSFSQNLNCTRLTTSCPNATQWSERGKMFNCPGNRRYVCLMAPGSELREGCIFNFTIQAGQTGCPYTTQCDRRTGQPLLVTHNNYLPCPSDDNGCPAGNHSGYSILEIYKYARCQGRNSSDESSVSPDKANGTLTTIIPSKTPRNWTIIIISTTIGFIAISVIITLIASRKKCKRRSKNSRSMIKDSRVMRTISSCFSSTLNNESSLPLLSRHKDDNGQYHCTSSYKRYPKKSFIIAGQDTPLHEAASNGDINSASKILNDGKADVNARDGEQNTPLHTAASNGHISIVKILIDAQADVNAKNLYENTPLHKAASNGHSNIVKILIDAEADVNAKDLGENTPLHKAASIGHIEIVKLLIYAKADIDVKGWGQGTPLHNAASNDHTDTVKSLVEAKADVNAKDSLLDTALHKAVSNGNIEAVAILIDAKADINLLDMGRNTPLFKAVSYGHFEIIKRLINASADVNTKNAYQDTPLHMAASNGHTDTVKVLLNAKGDVNSINLFQDTPLHIAASSGHSDTVEILIKAKADVNAIDTNRITPLHNAAERGHLEIIRILLSSAADFSIRNNHGKTAEELGNLKSKQVFRDCMAKVPNEIKQLGVGAIRQFLNALNEDAVLANVVSCMFVGHIGVGKTTLVNNLLGLRGKKTKTTSGIDLHIGKIFANIHNAEWHIQDEQTEKIIRVNDYTQINVWDFAGNMMYYTMHQDHLSPRRLYMLVFNASVWMDGMVDDHSVEPSDKGKRSVKDYIEFWVTTITTYIQSDVRGFPKIVLVGTHIDQLLDTLKISQIIEEIKMKFQPLIDSGQLIVHEDLFINALDMKAERKLRDIILSCGTSYPEYGQMIPRSWNDLQKKLILRKSESVISFHQLEQMNSQMEKPLNEKELIFCMEYFHSLGYLLFFSDEELKDHVVLDPRWITNVMLSFIARSNSTSESGRVQKWLPMETTGKIQHAYFDEMLLGNNAEARDSHHLHRVMKKLDLLSEPKVYNAEGFEESQNYFYMPCILNRDISPHALSLTENKDAVHFSFSFSTVVPPVVYNRLIASSFSLWPVFEGHIYNGLILLRSGPLHLISFKREYMQINISVVHLEKQNHINVFLCRTIVQFAEQRLTWILSIYNTSTVKTKSLFHITYNPAAAESLKDRNNEVIRLNDKHPFRLDPAYLQTHVHSELLHAVADRISNEYIHVGVGLKLKADAILKLLKNFKGGTVELKRAILQEWYDNNKKKGHVKIVILATALLNAKCDISVLYEFEKQIFHDRNAQIAKRK